MSQLMHNRSFQMWVFPSKWLQCYWQPKTRKQNNTYASNRKETEKLSELKEQSTPSFGTAFTLWPLARKWTRLYSYNPGARTGRFYEKYSDYQAEPNLHEQDSSTTGTRGDPGHTTVVVRSACTSPDAERNHGPRQTNDINCQSVTDA